MESDGYGVAELTTQVNRQELINKLLHNRTVHRDEFALIRVGWLNRLALELGTAGRRAVTFQEKINKLRLTETINQKVGFDAEELVPACWSDAPTNYEGYYTSAIEMLEASDVEYVTLTRTLFSQLMKNKWRWTTTHKKQMERYHNDNDRKEG